MIGKGKWVVGEVSCWVVVMCLVEVATLTVVSGRVTASVIVVSLGSQQNRSRDPVQAAGAAGAGSGRGVDTTALTGVIIQLPTSLPAVPALFIRSQRRPRTTQQIWPHHNHRWPG